MSNTVSLAEILSRTPEFDQFKDNASMVYQRGYKSGLAKHWYLELDRLFNLSHEDYALVCELYQKEAGIDAIPYCDPVPTTDNGIAVWDKHCVLYERIYEEAGGGSSVDQQ